MTVLPPIVTCSAVDPVAQIEPVEVGVPRLFQIYLRYGAKVCGPPALDRRFKTIDFLVMFDVFEMDGPTRKIFFGK